MAAAFCFPALALVAKRRLGVETRAQPVVVARLANSRCVPVSASFRLRLHPRGTRLDRIRRICYTRSGHGCQRAGHRPMSSDIRKTEERLRTYLDANQVMRERMCLALLPLLGPYTREQPRRPKGGPDGARDLEAIFDARIPVWGAVGFRNGGGNDNEARGWAAQKFKDDLDAARQENPTLPGFVFFTNVDLTPGIKQGLMKYAQEKSVSVIEIFDMERLRNALDSPEGLLARLQYLGIEMQPTEQLALIGKYGTQLQGAVTARFDRVERTLSQMERFLDFQKPILRLDFYFELVAPTTSAAIGDEAILLVVHGLHDLNAQWYCLCRNNFASPTAQHFRVMSPHMWDMKNLANLLTGRDSIGWVPNIMISLTELSLNYGIGNRLRLADLTLTGLEAICTEGLRSKIRRLSVDINGYEVFNHAADGQGDARSIPWATGLSFNPTDRKWFNLLMLKQRNMLLSPPSRSPRFGPIVSVNLPK